MAEISGIRILEKENNKKGDLFARLMKDLFLTLGYDNPRLNIHKTGREIDIEAVHRTENRRAIAECKATEKKIGGDHINKFAGVLDGEKKRRRIKTEGYFISLSGFTEAAIEQEKEFGNRVILLDANDVIDELIDGNIIVSEKRAMEQAVHCAAGHGSKLRADESFELLAHDMGWIWVVYFTQNKQRTHFALVHADGEALAPEPAQAVIKSDKSVGGELYRLEYLPPPGHPSISDKSVNEAREKYLQYLKSECGDITLEGMPADQEVGPRSLNLENLFVPLHLEPSGEEEQEPKPPHGKIPPKSKQKGRQPVGGILSDNARLAILAAPGGGKTTLIKRLAVAYAFPERRTLIDDKLPDRSWLPLFIRCRQLQDRVSWPVIDILHDIASRAEISELKGAFSLLVNRTLRDGDVLLLVDGLDEISNEGHRVRFVTQLRTFLATYPNVNVIVTSREAGFRIVGGALSAQCKHYKVADFDDDDITRLILSWHKEVMGDRPEVREEAEKLAKTITGSDRIRQLAKNPLLLTTLLLVKRWVGQLPTRRSVLYGKAIEVLLMTWNVEGYEPMDQDEAIPQLAFVAFAMMKDGVQRISERRLKEVLSLARKEMPEVLGYARYSVAEFIKRVELRSSLLMLSGHEIEAGTLYPMYEFRHLTFQEYLTARAIVDGYYPDRKDGDTLLSILEPHLKDEEWREVVPLAAVLAGRKVQPLVQHLIDLCKKLKESHIEEHRSQYPVALLSQCILDEIQLAPKLLEEALEWIARRTATPSSLILSLFKGRYGEVLQKVVQDAYMSSDIDQINLGGVLGHIYLHRMGWTNSKDPDSQFYEKIADLLDSENDAQKSIGALAVTEIAFNVRKDIPAELKETLKMLGDRIVPSLYSETPYLHFAACWAFVWLGVIGVWTPEHHPDVLSRLSDLWKNSRLPDVQYMASWSILSLPIMDRELKPLPEADADSLKFIKENVGDEAALVMGYYWKKPWTDEELAEKVEKTKTEFIGWKRTKARILEVLGAL
jgi:hypothetical protein